MTEEIWLVTDCSTMILVVDGNSYISGKIAEHFFMNGESCCVSQCNCLECAARLTAALPFTFVLMDALTVSVGHEDFIQFKTRNSNVKIFVYSTKLSGAEFSVVQDMALKAGADFFGDEFQVINHVREELARIQAAVESGDSYISKCKTEGDIQ